MFSFITGSHAYKTSTTESDIDLVILVTPETKDELISLSEEKKMPCKFGKLNLIFVTTPEEYSAWLLGKINCVKERGGDRNSHIELHNSARAMFGVEYTNQSGTT